MSFEIRSDQVDVDEIMRSIRERIEEKKKGLYTDDEIRQIAEHKLEAVIGAHDFSSRLIEDLRRRSSSWHYEFGPESIYGSSRGASGKALETLRRWLRPIQKLFWNPDPMIRTLHLQSQFNREIDRHHNHVLQILHSFAVEITKLNLEVQELKNRALELQGRLDFQARREKTLESMVAYRKDTDGAGGEGT